MNIDKYIKKIIISETEISKKCKELATWINHEYRKSEKLVIIGLLRGSFTFLSDLTKHVKIIHKIDFIKTSSYNNSIYSEEKSKILIGLYENIENCDVIIVEDIIDTGFTLSTIKKQLYKYKPKSIKVLVLFDKTEARKIDFYADKVGFKVPNQYLVGYGLDCKGKFRHLPYLAIFNLKYIESI